MHELNYVKQKIDIAERELKDIQRIMEEETNRKIKLLAEGHMDLNRNQDEERRVKNQKEVLTFRISHLENELEWAKARLEKIPSVSGSF